MFSRFDLIIGRSTFFFRDVQTTHAPALAAFRTIGFSHTNPFASFGQPYLGNPNLLVSYPFFKSPDLISLQIIIHLVLCLIGMIVLLRRLGASADAAWFGAVTFTLSGYVLSAASSLNSVTTIGWIPWVLWSAEEARQGQLYWKRMPVAAAIATMFLLAGEPVLIGVTILLALVLIRPWHRENAGAKVRWITAGLIGMAVTAPVHFLTWRAASASFRVVRGYAFESAVTASLHPARLLEILVPFVFGDPSKIGPGAFWGYAVSRGARPYVYSVTISLVALSCALAFGRRSWSRQRFWVVSAALFLLLSFGGFLPGAEALFSIGGGASPVRFPIKFFLFFTLSVSLLAAFAFDHILDAGVQQRSRFASAAVLGGFSIVLVTIAGISASAGAALQRGLVALWWSPSWAAAPELVLPPIVSAIPARLFACSVIIGIAGWVIARGGGTIGRVALHATVLIEGLMLVPSLMPAVPSSVYEQRSPLVEVAASIPGRVFERAAKDLDPVLNGLRGSYASNDVRLVATAQARQGWALSGIRHGIRYAFDPSPDGSYTDRNQLVHDVVDKSAWPLRMKWLRAGGVAAVITPERANEIPGVAFRAMERGVGVPVGLYAIREPLAEVRRAGRAVPARSAGEAIALFALPSFDETSAIVVEGDPILNTTRSEGPAIVRGQTADTMEIETHGAGEAYVFIARSYTPLVRATTAEGRPLPVVAANVTWIGVRVPSGQVSFRIRF